MAVAIDKISQITVPDYTGFGKSIEKLTAKQTALVLSTKNLSQEELEEVVIQNKLLEKYGVEELVKSGLLAANSSLIASEKALNAEEFQKLLTEKGVSEETAKRLIQQNLQIVTNGNVTSSVVMLNQALMDEAIKKGILTKENADQILSTLGVVAADKLETGSKKSLAVATWELVKANIAWLTTNPLGWLTTVVAAIGTAIYAVVKITDTVTTSLDEQKEKLQDTKDAYENLKSELQEVENEIQNTQNAIDELNNKPSPSWVEQEELERLREVTKELERQKQLKQDEQLNAAEDLYKENEETFNKEFVSSYGNTSVDDLVRQLSLGNIGVGQLDLTGNITDMIAALQYLNEEKKKLTDESEIAEYDLFIENLTSSLKSNASEYLSSLSEYKLNILEIANVRDLTDDEQEFYDYLSSMQKLIYKFYSPETWNTLEFDSIFDIEGLEKTKEELIKMAKEGTLDESIIQSYSKLNSILEDSNLILREDQSAASALCDEIYTLAEAEKEIDNNLHNNKTGISLSAWQSSLYSPDQTYSDLIRDWESQINQLQSVLSDIRSGDTAMTAADIVSQFPDLQPYIDQYDDLALAVDTFMRDSYQELLDKFGDTSNIEGFFYELEYLQGVLTEGLGGANNIDHLVSTYEELIGILDQVNSDHTFTEEEIANLTNKYDALKDAVVITADGYKLEDEALIDLINNYVSLSNTAISGQIELTQTTIEGIEARVKAWGMEIEALKTIANIYNATGGSEDAVGKYIYDNYGTNLTSATPAIIAAATEYTAASDQLDKLLGQLRDGYTTGSGYKSGGSSSSTAQSFTDTLEKELDALDKSMEAGYMDFNDYITARLGLIEDYYRKGKISADEYYSYLEKHYDKQLSIMDRVVGAVTRRIDKEIDGLEKQKDSIESAYNAQIESLEKQKTLLQEANKERERQVDLQKALYELERAKQQKTRMVFTEDGGMRYVTDDDAIRDAGQNVENARLEIQIAELDRSISKLEDARDRETAAIDETISKLKEYKDAWSDVTSAYEEEQDNLLAAQILGQEWEADILNGRLETLRAFKDEYISIQQAMINATRQLSDAQQETQRDPSDPSSAGTVSSSGPHTGLGNNSDIKYVAFNKYASGTDNAKKGINLVGEDGTEAYFDNHGHIALITKPTLIPMEGGEVVKNESATRKLLDPNNLSAVDARSLSDSADPIASGRLRPVQAGDRAWELQQSLIAYLAKMGSDINSLVAPVNAIQRDTEQIAGMNRNTNPINNGNHMQQVTVGDIHITCPGVTSQEIMNQVGEALSRQLGGIALDALQESTKR